MPVFDYTRNTIRVSLSSETLGGRKRALAYETLEAFQNIEVCLPHEARWRLARSFVSLFKRGKHASLYIVRQNWRSIILREGHNSVCVETFCHHGVKLVSPGPGLLRQ